MSGNELFQRAVCPEVFCPEGLLLDTLSRTLHHCGPVGTRVPASAGGKGGNLTSAWRQVTLCDLIWHVSLP